MDKASGTNNRLPYHKPELVQVLLKAEEAVLASCKTKSLGGPELTECGTGGPGACSGLGGT